MPAARNAGGGCAQVHCVVTLWQNIRLVSSACGVEIHCNAGSDAEGEGAGIAAPEPAFEIILCVCL